MVKSKKFESAPRVAARSEGLGGGMEFDELRELNSAVWVLNKPFIIWRGQIMRTVSPANLEMEIQSSELKSEFIKVLAGEK